jgi:hypothetical protein
MKGDTAMSSRIDVTPIFTAEEIAASEIAFCAPINMDRLFPTGYFGVQIFLTGDGTLKLEWLISADGKNYLAPSEMDNIICEGFTKASGSHSIEYGDKVHILDVVGMVEINGKTGTVTATDATTATLDIDSSLFTAYTSGGIARPVGKDTSADAVITAISQATGAVLTIDRGRDWFRLSPPPAPYLKIKATETGGADAITLTARLIVLPDSL